MVYLKVGIAYCDTNRYYSGFEYMFVLSKGRLEVFNPIRDRLNISFGRKDEGTQRQKDGSTIPRKGKTIGEFGVRYNYWNISNASRGIHTQNHPAVFPLQLANDHIYSWSNEGDVILDPFVGSGTTCLAAIKLNRKYIGIDISQEYCDLAQKRIDDELKQLDMFRDNSPTSDIFEPSKEDEQKDNTILEDIESQIFEVVTEIRQVKSQDVVDESKLTFLLNRFNELKYQKIEKI